VLDVTISKAPNIYSATYHCTKLRRKKKSQVATADTLSTTMCISPTATGTMAFPSSWTATFVSSLAILSTFINPAQSADTPETVSGRDANGVATTLLADRYPALYTGNFGDCMGGQSLINLTAFDAAYYADNSTVLLNMRGTTSLRNESLMSKFRSLRSLATVTNRNLVHISVDACKQFLDFHKTNKTTFLTILRWRR